MRTHHFLVAVLGLALASRARAQELELASGIFFSGTAGASVARIDHPELTERLRLGALVALDVGWLLSERWVIGGEFVTWGTSVLGIPVHLHTLGPRLEFMPSGLNGPYARAVAGLALTEGSVTPRAGGAASGAIGYRWFADKWIALLAEAGGHGHVYENGSAVFPFVALLVRFYGSTL